MIFFEAVGTLISLGRWMVAWLVVLAVVATMCLLTALATGAYAVRVVWRSTNGPSWARSRREAKRLARASRDYDEAA
ncbi:hypothetical protein [Streptomyces sp. L2]|uniref:hypothetical protein n=1 Tax=Streptomyces sp. L2 TaxID=2162665 RepID=UPI001010C3B6|nr:hypothetical protein [Streptomyces sp. L2]